MMKMYMVVQDIKTDGVLLGLGGECPYHKGYYINMLDQERKVFRCGVLSDQIEAVHPLPARWVCMHYDVVHGTNP